MEMMQIKIGIDWNIETFNIQSASDVSSEILHVALEAQPSQPLLPFCPGFTDLAEEAQGTFIVQFLEKYR
jgi:hypothetical protein